MCRELRIKIHLKSATQFYDMGNLVSARKSWDRAATLIFQRPADKVRKMEIAMGLVKNG